uniref:hypothetical protein n=1 Tax=Streptomyces sp. TRM64462 TaxID=2741726 RepID=UPI001C30A4A6
DRRAAGCCRGGMSDGEQSGSARLQASARGWHTIQLAVLGFVGLCGVLKSGESAAPRGLEAAAGVLLLVALAVACCATYLVGRAAWPPTGREVDVVRDGRRLRRGLWLTFAAVVLVAVATASEWWPAEDADRGGLVRVTTSAGTACGTLEAGGEGVVRLRVEGRSFHVPMHRVAELAPAARCP